MLRKYYVRMYRECYIVINNRIVIRVYNNTYNNNKKDRKY